MVSCYPLFNEEDINWKHKTGFVQDFDAIDKEYLNAKNIKVSLCAMFGSVCI